MKLRIGTRKSPLALAQAEEIRTLLTREHPELTVELAPMTTTGDQITDRTLSDIGGKGLFTKEIEEALLENRIDIAVHSAKDMQTVLPQGLMLACVPKREDVRDVLIGAESLKALPEGATLGTASLRRGAQALLLRPDLKLVPLRGNVQTRLRKIEAGEANATLLALAGLKRLNMQPLPGVPIPIETMLPATAQAAIGIECRVDDAHVRALLAPLNHAESFIAVAAERAFLRKLDGSCRTPIAAYATVTNDMLHLRGALFSADGKQAWKVERSGPAHEAEALGEAAGAVLKQRSSG